MILLKIDWTEYDKRKKAENTNTEYFFSETKWESRFLIAKVRKNFPNFPHSIIEKMIVECGKNLPIPRLRVDFIGGLEKMISGKYFSEGE